MDEEKWSRTARICLQMVKAANKVFWPTVNGRDKRLYVPPLTA